MNNLKIPEKNKKCITEQRIIKKRGVISMEKNKINKERANFSVRTDLAIEATELIISANEAKESEEKNGNTEKDELDGIEIKEEIINGNIKLTKVKITNKNGEESTGKPKGNYITIESQAMKENDADTHEEIIKVLSENIADLTKLDKKALILIVGLGNRNITPDALGPLVISKILVTRHITESLPEQIDHDVRAVSAISPGVMGITGIETGEIIKGICESIKPDLIIAVDALAARKTERINATIQMSDTGISPGSGVGNKRMALNQKTLGIPVIAIGVPTVVDAATLINDTMDKVLNEMSEKAKKGGEFYKMLQTLDKEEKYNLIYEILTPCDGNMFVTPKEVDAVVKRLANIISNGINIALHPAINKEDINRYFN